MNEYHVHIEGRNHNICKANDSLKEWCDTNKLQFEEGDHSHSKKTLIFNLNKAGFEKLKIECQRTSEIEPDPVMGSQTYDFILTINCKVEDESDTHLKNIIYGAGKKLCDYVVYIGQEPSTGGCS